MSIENAFDQSVEYYDKWMKLALPSYDELFEITRELIPFAVNKPIEVLDLGAGTGLFSEHVFRKYLRAKFTLCDLAPKMLDVARKRFQEHPSQFEYRVGDYRELNGENRYDLVISSLSIHHLEDEEKRQLFKQIYRALKDTGIFINVDQIKGPTPEMQKLYWENWLEKVREKGAEKDQIQASIQRRKEYDKDATLTDQLAWLSEAGFVNVDCVYKNYFIGVFFVEKAI
jgi:tRNA (cmo5U34)-methyltransferase